MQRAGYRIEVLLTPNKAAAPNSFALRITKGGQPVRGATVTLTLNHLEMQMPQQQYGLTETQPGIYSRSAPALVMVGKWGLSFQIAPKGASAVHGADRRPGERLMTAHAIWLRLLAAFVALGCGVAALLVAILLVRGVVA